MTAIQPRASYLLVGRSPEDPTRVVTRDCDEMFDALMLMHRLETAGELTDCAVYECVYRNNRAKMMGSWTRGSP